MTELSNLLNKSDRELKICIKNHIINDEFNLNWTYIFERYFVYMKINRQQNEVDIFRDLCIHKKEKANLLDEYYINKKVDYYKINSVKIYNTVCMELCIELNGKNEITEFEEYYLFEGENMIKILEFLFHMLKEVITFYNDFYNSLDSFVVMEEKEDYNMEETENDLL